MTLDAHVVRRLGSFELDVALQVADGETIAVLGPNGAGKSTLLRALAGLVELDDGVVRLDAAVLDEPATRTFTPPEHRPIGVVFQDYLLFPHLSALENVAFGLRAGGTPKAAARRTAGDWLARVGLADQADHRPGRLSGGQAQRVALARALAPAPRLLLLDEPLAALDVATRHVVRRDLRHHLASFSGVRIIVTHDPVDAYALADRVVIIEQGRIVQTGSLDDLTARPRSAYIADLVGVNLLAGLARDGTITLPSGGEVVTTTIVDGPTFAVIAPHSVALYRRPPEGSPRNVWPVRVTDLSHRADRVRVQLDGPVALVAEITTGARDALELQPGEDVWATVKATEVTTYPD